MNGRLRVAGAVLAVAVFVGCSSAQNAQPQKLQTSPAETPREAVVRAMTALRTGDRAAFYSVADVQGKQGEMVEAYLDLYDAMGRFQDRFIEVYGKSAWGEFYEENKNFGFIGEDILEKANDVAIDTVGDKATFELRDFKRAARKDGRWLIDVAPFAKAKEVLTASHMAKFVEAFRQVRELISKKRTAKEIQVKLWEEVWQAAADAVAEEEAGK